MITEVSYESLTSAGKIRISMNCLDEMENARPIVIWEENDSKNR